MEEATRRDIDFALMQAAIPRIEASVNELCTLIRGNGDDLGLKGKAERHWLAIKALFWINGATALLIIGTIVDHIYRFSGGPR